MICLGGTNGWWNSVAAADLRGNGRTDLVLGNLGLNSYLRASPNEPAKLYINDFAHDGGLEQILAPALRPGMVVVMDNLPCHKVAGVAEAIQAAGCRLEYLPPYSPDLNPIENAFSKLKRGLRDWAARTAEGVYAALRGLITHFDLTECLNYFRHCGYVTATAA